MQKMYTLVLNQRKCADKMKKSLVLLSGGIDSAVALALTIKEHKKENVEAITFDYGQKNHNEIAYSKKLAEHYGITNTIINISNLFKFSNSSLLNHSTKELSHLTYDEQVIKNNAIHTDTNVPFRNGLFLSIAASYAISKNIDNIVYGIHSEIGVVRDLYPDCSKEFNENIAKAIYAGSGNKVTVVAPLVKHYKKDVVGLGIELEVPFEKTWTCYDNKEHPCGKCNSCQDRLKAFADNNSKDPIEYLN